MKSSFCIDLQRFMLIPTKFPLSLHNIINQQFSVIGFFESFITKKSLKKILRLFCGVYEARTRDPMRDRHVF